MGVGRMKRTVVVKRNLNTEDLLDVHPTKSVRVIAY